MKSNSTKPLSVLFYFATVFISGLLGYPQSPKEFHDDNMGTAVPPTPAMPKSSLYYIYPNSSNPEEMKKTIRIYTKELFSPIGLPLRYSPMVILVDTNSFLREDPRILENFGQLVQVFDIGAEMEKKMSTDLFGPVYEYERRMKDGKVPRSIEQNHRSAGDAAHKLMVDKTRLFTTLKSVFTVPRSYVQEPQYRHAVGDYIGRKFGTSGLITIFQSFQPTQFHEIFFKNMYPNIPSGSNILGVYPGSKWGSPEDEVLILAAHWDTMEHTDGYNDNGSGVATILTIAQALAEKKCKLANSVIFAAFDLEEVGEQGSLEFVQRFLIPEVMEKFGQKKIKGAYVIDTIMNYNRTEGSQQTPEDQLKVLPGVAKYLKANGYRGDYLNIVRRSGRDQELVDPFQKNWEKLNRQKSKSDENLPLYNSLVSEIPLSKEVPEMEELESLIEFMRSDHARFWMANTTKHKSLNAVLLTDTGPHRGGSQSCYHAECDSVRNGNSAPFADEDFFLHTVQTLLDTTVELSQAQCQDGFGYRRSKEDEGEGGSSHHGHSSWIQSSFLLLTASMILCNL